MHGGMGRGRRAGGLLALEGRRPLENIHRHLLKEEANTSRPDIPSAPSSLGKPSPWSLSMWRLSQVCGVHCCCRVPLSTPTWGAGPVARSRPSRCTCLPVEAPAAQMLDAVLRGAVGDGDKDAVLPEDPLGL